jgi:hypothetical protein
MLLWPTSRISRNRTQWVRVVMQSVLEMVI